MKRFPEGDPDFPKSERALCSVRAVLARTADLLWQADPSGAVTSITLCRPARAATGGTLDETEIAQIEQLWKKATRCAERFSAVFHARPGGEKRLRNFLVQAVPVFDERDEVLYWSGHATEVERFADIGTRFISEATGVLSSSLKRPIIVNRLIESAIGEFCDACAVHVFDDEGALALEGFADRRAGAPLSAEALEPLIEEAARARQPALLLGSENERLRALRIRSAMVVPLLSASSCVGALTFVESELRASFAARELDISVVVGRQLALALENIKTFEREKHVTQRFRFLARITERLFATLDVGKTLSLLMEGLADGFADRAIAALLENGRLRSITAAGTAAEFSEVGEREIVAALHQRRSLHNGVLRAGPLHETTRPVSWLMAPLFSGDSVYGAIVCSSQTRHYDRSDLELLEEIGRRASLALEHAESFARERRLIQTLQQATLPAHLAKVTGASLSAVYRPAASEVQVGGDWYDAYELDDHRVLLSVGDVTGHGLEASVVMGKLRHAINVVALYERNPARILDAAERILMRRYPTSIATAFAAVFDSRDRTLTYANAGHPYPLLRRFDGSILELEADGLPLGLRHVAAPAEALAMRVEDAALLALFTDGLIEATRDVLGGEQRLREAVGRETVFFADNPAEFIEKYCLREPSPDDVAILVLNFFRASRWKLEPGNGESVRQARREFAARLESRAVSPSDLGAAELIFGELVSTAAQCGARSIEIALEWRALDAVVHVILRDLPTSKAERDRALWLVGRLGANLSVEEVPGFGTHVKAALPLSH